MALFRKDKKNKSAKMGRRSDEVIDLRTPPPARGDLVWGMPSRCPECGDFGYLDTVDVERRVMFQHCPSCWAKWEITEEQIDAQNTTNAR